MARRYSKNHLWIEEKTPGLYNIGLTAQAMQHLEDVVAVFFPSDVMALQTFSRDFLLVVIESTKSAVDIELPCALELVEVNVGLLDHPGSLTSQTWLACAKIQAIDMQEFLDEESYNQLCCS